MKALARARWVKGAGDSALGRASGSDGGTVDRDRLPGPTQRQRMIFLLATVAAVGLIAGGVRLWRWAAGRSVLYRVVASLLVAVGLYVLLLAVGLFLNPL